MTSVCADLMQRDRVLDRGREGILYTLVQAAFVVFPSCLGHFCYCFSCLGHCCYFFSLFGPLLLLFFVVQAAFVVFSLLVLLFIV